MPIVPGSSVKGVLRSLSAGELQRAVFGPDTDNASEHAGALRCSDALLAFLPVRSVRGTFAWATSPYLVRQLQRAFAEAGLKLPAAGAVADDATSLVCPQAKVCDRAGAAVRLVLEDFALAATESKELATFAGALASSIFVSEDDRTFFLERVTLVHDDVMRALATTCMEITARNALDPETHTVRRGALWTEEALPVESVLVGMMAAAPANGAPRSTTVDEILAHVRELTTRSVQIGGHASVGRGLCRVGFLGGVA
jgi:CRISPR-associated protein Cmr4